MFLCRINSIYFLNILVKDVLKCLLHLIRNVKHVAMSFMGGDFVKLFPYVLQHTIRRAFTIIFYIGGMKRASQEIASSSSILSTNLIAISDRHCWSEEGL